MNISRFEPWSLINILHRDLDQIAERRYGLTSNADNGNSVADWVPAVDIVEEKDRYIMRADVPGVSPEDIEVSMENGVLSVSGQRVKETTDEIDGMRRLERVSGKFFRRFTLPDSANADGISASTENGILKVVIPKRPQVQARRIAVNSA